MDRCKHGAKASACCACLDEAEASEEVSVGKRACDECDKPMAVVHHCQTPDCCANCGEEVRWDERGFRRGLNYARRILGPPQPDGTPADPKDVKGFLGAYDVTYRDGEQVITPSEGPLTPPTVDATETAIAAAHTIVGTLGGVSDNRWSVLYLAVKDVCDRLRVQVDKTKAAEVLQRRAEKALKLACDFGELGQVQAELAALRKRIGARARELEPGVERVGRRVAHPTHTTEGRLMSICDRCSKETEDIETCACGLVACLDCLFVHATKEPCDDLDSETVRTALEGTD